MRVVPLAAIPNQSFTVTLSGVRWALRIATASGVTVCDVSRESVTLAQGVRALAGQPLIPYKRQETGNFIFVTDGEALPAYQQFGVTQTLVYLEPAEIAALAAAGTVTYEDIDPFQPSLLTDDDGFYLTTDDGSLLTDD